VQPREHLASTDLRRQNLTRAQQRTCLDAQYLDELRVKGACMAQDENRRGDEQPTESGPPRPQDPSPRTPEQRPRFRISPWWIAVALGLIVINFWVGSRVTDEEDRLSIPYSPFFLDQVRKGNVARITSEGSTIQGKFLRPTRYSNSDPKPEFETEVPAFADTDELSRVLERNGVVVNAEPLDTGTPLWQSLLVSLLPAALLIGLLFFILRRAGSAQSAIGAFGRSRARRYQPSGDRITFADVAGVEEAEAELVEVVDFLRNPGKYRSLGGRIPRGVLLTGPPGTGKTLLARAVAGEANAPFFSLSASEFVEAIVGIGASRVRDLFAQAKEAAPAIVFIDELDAIGRSRTSAVAGFSGGNDEREQTLNQILTEMDGFDSSTSVIVIGATNRPEILDQALLRPGRFDRRVAVQLPDRDGREEILKVHTRGVPLAPEVDLGRIASSTPGMAGADLANLVNEAALLAARRNHRSVEESDFTDALERIVLGAERQIMMSPEDRRRTAFHEAGHAIVGMLTEGADPVRKISIIPRGVSLGVTFSAPDADRYSYDEQGLRARIKVALGGRAADEVVYGGRTTGAESDIQQLTEIARAMVGRWGMSQAVGPLAVIPADGRGPFFPGGAEVSEHTQKLIDDEIRRIVDEAHEEVVVLLRENRSRLDALAKALLERETLDEEEAYAVAGVTRVAPGGRGMLRVSASTDQAAAE
jgi:cell division protease FtsH